MKDILDKFQNLGRYKDAAPHKPLLVLAVLDWIEELKLEQNEIPIDTGLYELFDEYWNKLYKPNKAKRIHYPIRYLQTDDLGWKVLVNDKLFDERPSAYSIDQFRGKRIWLPYKEGLWPSQELLSEHRKTHFS